MKSFKILSYFLSLSAIGYFIFTTIYDKKEKSLFEQPKLVVGIVVDQMRYDYLTRFWNHYGEGGFKRLVKDGFTAKNHHFNYVPTVTGPGHASIYSGTTPAVHGILGNDWYNRAERQMVYCVDDLNHTSLNTSSSKGKSPHRMSVSTITDELRIHHQFNSKVISIAIKDRSAVLPGGHSANAAYWYEGEQDGDWISSTYYMDELPDWVKAFNAGDSSEKYLKTWNQLKGAYVESGADENPYESTFDGEESNAFPHEIGELWSKNDGFDILKDTPFGNSLTTDFAIEALKNENLGTDAITDFLAISFSSTDYVGHEYGVNSKEVQDTYIRLDQDIERLLNVLDSLVGQNEYTLFLSSDHGAMHNSEFLRDAKIPTGKINRRQIRKDLEERLDVIYGISGIIENVNYNEIVFNKDVLKKHKLNQKELTSFVVAELMKRPEIEHVFTAEEVHGHNGLNRMKNLVQNGHSLKYSGDIVFIQKPGYISNRRFGSTHASGMNYDTHVPLLFYGQGITKGSTVERTEIPDIAPTISVLLGISFPNGTTGNPIKEVFDH
jgi:predicted AlkP superfamily pyrophosphatase or phosphodiesterase